MSPAQSSTVKFTCNTPCFIMHKKEAGAGGVGSSPGSVKSDTVANGSPLLRHFFGTVLPRHLAAEMGPATRFGVEPRV